MSGGLAGVWGAGGAWGVPVVTCPPRAGSGASLGPGVALSPWALSTSRAGPATPHPCSQIASPSCACVSSCPGWGISCCWRWIMLMSGFVSHCSLPGEAELIPSSLGSPSSHPLPGAASGWIQRWFVGGSLIQDPCTGPAPFPGIQSRQHRAGSRQPPVRGQAQR